MKLWKKNKKNQKYSSLNKVGEKKEKAIHILLYIRKVVGIAKNLKAAWDS